MTNYSILLRDSFDSVQSYSSILGYDFPKCHAVSDRGLNRRSVVRFIRNDPLINHISDDGFLIMLERDQKIRKHTMDPSACRIIALMAGNGDPFLITAFQFADPLAVITEVKITGFAFRTEIFAAVR